MQEDNAVASPCPCTPALSNSCMCRQPLSFGHPSCHNIKHSAAGKAAGPPVVRACLGSIVHYCSASHCLINQGDPQSQAHSFLLLPMQHYPDVCYDLLLCSPKSDQVLQYKDVAHWS